MANPDNRKKFSTKPFFRGSQVIFGERAHLQEVLGAVRQADLPRKRKQDEIKVLHRLILARTRELNRITPDWDRNFKRANDPDTRRKWLERLASSLSENDYLMARALTNHREAPPELLARFAAHPYPAVRENVARHPRTPATVLRALAEDSREPLWFLVACNPSIPRALRERLRGRMRQMTPGKT